MAAPAIRPDASEGSSGAVVRAVRRTSAAILQRDRKPRTAGNRLGSQSPRISAQSRLRTIAMDTTEGLSARPGSQRTPAFPVA